MAVMFHEYDMPQVAFHFQETHPVSAYKRHGRHGSKPNGPQIVLGCPQMYHVPQLLRGTP